MVCEWVTMCKPPERMVCEWITIKPRERMVFEWVTIYNHAKEPFVCESLSVTTRKNGLWVSQAKGKWTYSAHAHSATLSVMFSAFILPTVLRCFYFWNLEQYTEDTVKLVELFHINEAFPNNYRALSLVEFCVIHIVLIVSNTSTK
jgi:hypothetical protein